MPGCAIDVSAPRPGDIAGNRRNVLCDRFLCELFITTRSTSNNVRHARGAYRRRIADPVAAREGRKRRTMEGAGQRSEGSPNMKAAIYTSYGPPDERY